RRKSRPNQRSIQRSHLPLINLPAKQPQLPLNPLPDNCRGIRSRRRILDRRLNMPVRNPPRPQVPSNPKLPLLPRFRPQPRELLRVPSIVQQVLPLQPLHHAAHNLVVLAAPPPPRRTPLSPRPPRPSPFFISCPECARRIKILIAASYTCASVSSC